MILEGAARKLASEEIPPQALIAYRAKYGWEVDPGSGLVFEVRPDVIFAMPEEQFPNGVTAGASPDAGSRRCTRRGTRGATLPVAGVPPSG